MKKLKRAWYLHALLDFVGSVMVFNATFNNDLAILWQLVLLAEVSGIFGENHRQVASYGQTLSHNVVSSTPGHERDLNSQYNQREIRIFQLPNMLNL